MKEGDKVMIFQDPITQKKLEGEAILIAHLDMRPLEIDGGRLEYWEVQFIAENGQVEKDSYNRSVFAAN